MGRLDKLRSCIKPKTQGIEIAPWHNPIASRREGFNAIIVDLFAYDELLDNAEKLGVSKDHINRIEKPDFIGDASNLLNILDSNGFSEEVEWIVSSHNFEHLTDPLKFLQDCAKILSPNGVLTMAIPDKRFCFDRFHATTTTESIIRTHYDDTSEHLDAWAKFKQHSMRSELKRDDGTCEKTWSSTTNRPESLLAKDNVREQFNTLKKNLKKVDSKGFAGHRWHFTPASLQLLILDLHVLGLINFSIEKIWDTAGCEFIVHLQVSDEINPSEEDYKIKRTELLLQIEDEHAYVSRAYQQVQRCINSEENTQQDYARKIDNSNDRKRLLYLSGSPNSIGHFYRVIQQMEVMERLGHKVSELDASVDYNEVPLEDYDALILFRYSHNDKLEVLMQRCRSLGVKLIFDIDDLIFKPELMNEKTWDYLRTATEKWRDLWLQSCHGYAKTLSRCDAALLTTESLRNEVLSTGKPAYVLPNGVGSFMLSASNRVLQYSLRKLSDYDGFVRMGYASGSATHQKDFAEIAPVIAQLLEHHEELRFVVVGHLKMDEFPLLQQYHNRIEVRPIVAHMELFKEYFRFDINLAPLQSGNTFCECKSQLKYHEAALVEVPTVASATQPFIDAIEHGETGFIARTKDDWWTQLDYLIREKDSRRVMGKKARQHATKRFGCVEQSCAASEILAYLL